MTWNSSRKFLLVAVSLLVFSLPSGGNDDSPSDVKVELDSQKLSLHVTVHCRSENSVSLAQWRLPWGGQQHIMHFVPVDSDGVRIDDGSVRDEYPDYRKVSIEPNGSVSGEINLKREIPNLNTALKKSDVHLFWFYRTPEELRITHYAGGWVLIPQQK